MTIGSNFFELNTDPDSGAVPVTEIDGIGLGPGQTASNLEYGIFIDITDPTPAPWSASLCCLHQETLIHTERGHLPIREVRQGDFVLNSRGERSEVCFNIKHSIPVHEFVVVGAGSLGKNKPSRDLLITGEHPLLVDGREVPAKELVREGKAQLMKTEATPVYTLCTQDKDWIMTQGVPAASYSKAGWKQFRRENSVAWMKQ